MFRTPIVALTALTILALSTPSLAKPPPKPAYHPVAGSVIAGPCAEASTKEYDPVTGRFECQSIAYVDGDWAGTATLVARGTIDPVSGNARGVVDELLDLTNSGGQSMGQLRLLGTMTVDGATGTLVVKARIASGTGPYKRAKGTVTSTGYMPITGGPSTATYKGSWNV